MTPKERATMQQALEALEDLRDGWGQETGYSTEVITALREALDQGIDCPCGSECIKCSPRVLLAEQAEQEPVAWAISHSLGLEFGSKYPMQETKEAAEQMARQHMGAVVVTPLYAAPVRTKDLTLEEIMDIVINHEFDSAPEFARAVIAADRKLNGEKQ